jgi:hypothetical protein
VSGSSAEIERYLDNPNSLLRLVATGEAASSCLVELAFIRGLNDEAVGDNLVL